jgi:hypothetical protein
MKKMQELLLSFNSLVEHLFLHLHRHDDDQLTNHPDAIHSHSK